MLSNKFWENEFDVTVNDIDRIENLIRDKKTPITVIDLTRKVIGGRLRYGEDLSPAVLSKWSGKESIRLWDPNAKWHENDNVIIVRNVTENHTPRYEIYFGVVKELNLQKYYVNIIVGNEIISYALTEPNNSDTRNVRSSIKQIVANIKNQENASNLEDQITLVIAQFGGKITSRIHDILSSDKEFISLGQYWYLQDLLEDVPQEEIIEIQKLLSSNNREMSLEEVFENLDFLDSNNLLQKFRIKKALINAPNFFTKITSTNGTFYKVSIPDLEKVQIINYAYDPNNYEIICAPGDKPSKKTLDRLLEYGLLIGVVRNSSEDVNGQQN